MVSCEDPQLLDGCMMYTAVYRDGKLCALSADAISVDMFENGEAAISPAKPVQLTGSGITAAVFIWNSSGSPALAGFKL